MARRAQSERFLAPHTLDASLLLALCKGLRLLFTGMPAALTDQHAHVFGSLRIVAVGVNKVLQEELHRACAPAAILNARKAGAVSSVSWGGLRAACMHMQQAACLCRRHSWQAAPLWAAAASEGDAGASGRCGGQCLASKQPSAPGVPRLNLNATLPVQCAACQCMPKRARDNHWCLISTWARRRQAMSRSSTPCCMGHQLTTTAAMIG